MREPIRISIVTPSFNQAAFLEETIRSVIDQGYPNLEYIIIDGGSTDGSADIIRKYADRLTYWVSEKDNGMYDAINKGFAMTTGEVMGWINSDDKHMPWTLHTVGELFRSFRQSEWITTLFPTCISSDGFPVSSRPVSPGYTRRAFMRGANLPGGDWHSEDYIQQEGTFWRRSLWDRCGGTLDVSLKHAGDFELWARYFAHDAALDGVPIPLGAFRFSENQKTNLFLDEYRAEAKLALEKNGGRVYGPWKSFTLRKFRRLNQSLQKRYWRHVSSKYRPRVFYRMRGPWELLRS